MIQPDQPLQPHEGLPAQAPVDILRDDATGDEEISGQFNTLLETESNPQSELPEDQLQNNDLSTSHAQLASENVDSNCDYCLHKEKYQNCIEHYLKKFEESKTEKAAIPFIEELALALGKDEDILKLWLLDENHEEYISAIKKLLLMQKLRLLQKTQGRFNPIGAIFLLQALHGLQGEI